MWKEHVKCRMCFPERVQEAFFPARADGYHLVGRHFWCSPWQHGAGTASTRWRAWPCPRTPSCAQPRVPAPVLIVQNAFIAKMLYSLKGLCSYKIGLGELAHEPNLACHLFLEMGFYWNTPRLVHFPITCDSFALRR